MENEQNQKLAVPLWRKIVGVIFLIFGVCFGVLGIGCLVYLHESGWFNYQNLYYQFDFFVAFALLSPFLILLGLFLISRNQNGKRYQEWLFASRKPYFFVSFFLFLYGAIELMCFGTLGPKFREAPGGYEFHGYGDFPVFFLLALALGGVGWFLRRANLKDVQQSEQASPYQNQLQHPEPSDHSHNQLTSFPALNPMQAQNLPLTIRSKSRLAYVLLAFPFFGLGLFGIHNFYALRIKCAVAQFLIAILSLGILTPINLIWGIFEICLVNRDGRGVPLQ